MLFCCNVARNQHPPGGKYVILNVYFIIIPANRSAIKANLSELWELFAFGDVPFAILGDVISITFTVLCYFIASEERFRQNHF